MCKPWKRQGAKATGYAGRKRLAEQRADLGAREQLG